MDKAMDLLLTKYMKATISYEGIEPALSMIFMVLWLGSKASRYSTGSTFDFVNLIKKTRNPPQHSPGSPQLQSPSPRHQTKTFLILQMTARKRIVLYHLAGCFAFLALPLILFPHPPEETDFLFSKPTQRDLIANVLMLAFFYLHYYVLIPRLYWRRRLMLYALCIVAGFGAITLLPSALTGRNPFQPAGVLYPIPANYKPGAPPPPVGSSFMQEIQHHIFLFLAVVLFSLLLRVRQWLFQERQDKLNAELSSLKAQINPHFLFNTLNSIYALAVKKDDRIADAVVNLSELMRYILKDAQRNKVPLQKELDYITNYIDLQKARLGNTACIHFVCSGQPADTAIAPLMLITFIENAFKYGINPDEDSEVRIQIDVDRNNLHMLVYNKKVRTVNDANSMGIGISNTKERLQLLYPAKHQLTIQNTNSYFSVNLTITLQ
jgi:hypothetical protein